MKKSLIVKILAVVVVVLIGVSIGYLVSNRHNFGEYDYPEYPESGIDYGTSLIDDELEPTPKVTIDDKVKQKELTDTLTDINIQEFKNLFKSSKKSMVVIVKDGCGYCKSYEPLLKETLEDLNIKMYRLSTTNLSVKEIEKLADYIYIEQTPSTYVIKDGKVLKGMSGYQEKEIISSFIDLFYLR